MFEQSLQCSQSVSQSVSVHSSRLSSILSSLLRRRRRRHRRRPRFTARSVTLRAPTWGEVLGPFLIPSGGYPLPSSNSNHSSQLELEDNPLLSETLGPWPSLGLWHVVSKCGIEIVLTQPERSEAGRRLLLSPPASPAPDHSGDELGRRRATQVEGGGAINVFKLILARARGTDGRGRGRSSPCRTQLSSRPRRRPHPTLPIVALRVIVNVAFLPMKSFCERHSKRINGARSLGREGKTRRV